MTLIIIITVILYIVVIGWTWNNLADISKIKKIVVIFIEVIVIYLLTIILFNISKIEINYESNVIESSVKNTIVILFTGLNALIILPYLNKQIMTLKETKTEINSRKVMKKLVILLVIFIICMFFECGYMKDTQRGILKVHQVRTQQIK